MRIYFGEEITSLSAQKVDGISPVFNFKGFAYRAIPITECFENASSTKYSTHATSDYTFYALFVGGNAYYHIFAPLQADWVVAPQA